MSVKAGRCCSSRDVSSGLRFKNTVVLVESGDPSSLAPNSNGGLRCESSAAIDLQRRSMDHLQKGEHEMPNSPWSKFMGTYQRWMEQLARHPPPLLQLPCCISEHSSSFLQHGQQWSVEEASVVKIGRLEGVAKALSRVFQKFKFGLPYKCSNRGVPKSGSLLLWGSPDRLLLRYHSSSLMR